MSRENEKMLKIIEKAIKEKGLTTEKEINDFLKNELSNKNLDDFDFDENATDEEIAMDLVYQAMDGYANKNCTLS